MVFDKPFRKEITDDSRKASGYGDAINMMVMTADQAMKNGDYERTAEGYKEVLKFEPNEAVCMRRVKA